MDYDHFSIFLLHGKVVESQSRTKQKQQRQDAPFIQSQLDLFSQQDVKCFYRTPRRHACSLSNLQIFADTHKSLLDLLCQINSNDFVEDKIEQRDLFEESEREKGSWKELL